VPHHVLKQHGEAWTKPEHIVGNGPYKVTKYTPQQEILLDKNEHYWDAANVKIDKARLRIITELDAVVKAYETGELHWTGAGLSMSQITKLLTHPDFRKEPMLGVYFYRVNVVKGGALGDVKVRQALSLAIDRDSLVDNVMNGLFTVARTFVPEGMAGYQSIIKAEDNVSKAKAMLKEAGFESGKDLGTIELLYNTDQNHKLVAEAVQQMWKQSLGLDVKLVNKEWKTYLQDLDTLSYQVARAGWIGDYNDPMTFLDMWVTNNGNNDTGWSHEEYDTLIERARREPRVSERVKLLQQAEAILLEQGPVIPIYFYTNNMLVSSAIEGFEPHNRDVHLLKYMSFKDAAK
jgi:oligopeptide transport system substrate-binding protein